MEKQMINGGIGWSWGTGWERDSVPRTWPPPMTSRGQKEELVPRWGRPAASQPVHCALLHSLPGVVPRDRGLRCPVPGPDTPHDRCLYRSGDLLQHRFMARVVIFHSAAAVHPVYGSCDVDLTPRVTWKGSRAGVCEVDDQASS
ncbi:transmembrane protein 128 [Phyllostomus discolor]|uniref:Transmembrane protein 128 n=1 Tax=Phyllostomus discolor TaxID=89673 RepID=A0A834EXM6_9CHIR|nr:transmembrane protein 128 [Phyllostomus discolor]